MKKMYYTFLLLLIIVFVSCRIQTMDVSRGISVLAYNTASTLGYNEVIAN